MAQDKKGARARKDVTAEGVNGEALKQQRDGADLTQEELADQAGVPPRNVQRAEAGERKTWLSVLRITEALARVKGWRVYEAIDWVEQKFCQQPLAPALKAELRKKLLTRRSERAPHEIAEIASQEDED